MVEMSLPPGRVSRTALGQAVVAVLAVVTLVLAPQRHHIESCSEHVAPLFLIGANLVLAVGLGLLAAWSWYRLDERLKPKSGWLALLPLALLWLPQFCATDGAVPQAHLLVLWPALGMGAAAVLFTLRRQGAATSRQIGTFAAVAALAFVLSWWLARMDLGGPIGFLLSCAWAAYLVAALTGWGRLVNRLLLARQSLDWGLRAALGMAALIVMGGLLNLTWSISPAVVLLLLAVGVGALAAGARWRGKGLMPERLAQRPGLVVVALIVVLAAGLQLAGSVAGTIDTVYQQPPFDQHDDEQGYLIFPTKMLELGSMGAEPFEGRRMLNLGGQSFLQSLVLVARPVRVLHLMDAGLGPLILLGLVLGAGRRHRLDWRLIAFVLLLTLSFAHLEMRGNTSGVLTGPVLLLAWFRLLIDGLLPETGPRSAAVVALLAAALCAVKSTFIPVAVVFLAVTTLCRLAAAPQRWVVVRQTLWTVLLIGLAVLPWMVSILTSSGTLLYPVLGKGFYGGVFTSDFASIKGDFSTPWVQLLQVMGKHLVRFWPLLLLLLFTRDRRPHFPVTALTLAALSHAVLAVVLGDPHLNRGLSRYAFTILMPAMIALVLAALRSHRDRGMTAALTPPVVVAVLVGGLWMVDHREATRRMYSQMLANTAEALTDAAYPDPQQRQATATLQQTVPPGQALLATLRTPFLLDFARQPTYIMSLPAMASLPPGIPVDDGPEAVADYLLSHSIRYVAYGGMADLRDLLNLTEENIRSRYPRLRMRWIMLRYHQRYRRLVHELAASRKILYLDRQRVVLDLASRVRTVIPSQRQGGLHGFRDGVWTGGNGVIDLGDASHEASVLVLRTMGWHPYGRDPRRLDLKVFADGRQLKRWDSVEGGLLFHIEPCRRVRRVRVVCSPVTPEAVGAQAGGPALGIDVKAIELAAARAAVERPIRTLRQPVAGALDPALVWNRNGFYRDLNWTNGDARLLALSWSVPEGHSDLVLSLHRADPCGHNPDELGVRLVVNGIELAARSSAEGRVTFRLYDGLREINEVRLISSTFVPSEQGTGADDRRLGIPVRLLETAAP